MDYGDGTFRGIFMFNTQYRKAEVCRTIDGALAASCPHITTWRPECGDGVVEGGEACECLRGTACAHCTDCRLAPGAQCTPDGVDGGCCTAEGRYAPTTALCDVAGGGRGFCLRGTCTATVCDRTSLFGEFCGLHLDNDCKISCVMSGACDRMEGVAAWGAVLPCLSGARYPHHHSFFLPCRFRPHIFVRLHDPIPSHNISPVLTRCPYVHSGFCTSSPILLGPRYSLPSSGFDLPPPPRPPHAVMRLPKGGLSAGTDRRKVFMCPPLGKRLRKWTSWSPKAAVGEGPPTAGLRCPLGRT